jgi:hypothetical protein
MSLPNSSTVANGDTIQDSDHNDVRKDIEYMIASDVETQVDGTTNEVVVFNEDIPAGTLGDDNVVIYEATLEFFNLADTEDVTYFSKFGGDFIHANLFSNSTGSDLTMIGKIQLVVFEDGTDSQKVNSKIYAVDEHGGGSSTKGYLIADLARSSFTKDTSSNQAVRISFEFSNSGDSVNVVNQRMYTLYNS